MRARTLIIVGLWSLALASVVAYFAAGWMSQDAGQLPDLFATPEFNWTDHHGQGFGSDDLAGKPWVGFIFLTHCPTGSCPLMIGQMADLQQAIPDERVQFVSFSVDPARDTPEVLAGYVDTLVTQRGGQVSDRWRLLTAAGQREVDELVGGLKMAYDQSGEHSTFFLLVDGSGKVRGVYGHTDPEGMERLARDARWLLAQEQAR